VPAAVLLASWLKTLWDGEVAFSTAALFAIGFVSLFIAGGLSGLFLARNDLTRAAVSEDFVIGHFHLVMGVAATFAILAALFFWFPKLFGCRLNETLGKAHFWLTFAGVYCIFMPMHWLGLLTQSSVLPDAQRLALISAAGSIRTLVAVATIWTVAAQSLFIVNFFGSLMGAKKVEENNPWHSSTLEWSIASPAPEESFGARMPVVYRGAYEPAGAPLKGFTPQHLSPEPLAQETR
jgi:cytochrome c oxidase subunit I